MTTATDEALYLTFQVAGEEYAVRLGPIREIIEYDTVTRVPSTPPWIRGVINLRGAVVPVVDVGLKFGLPESEITRRACIVVVDAELEGQPATTGVLVEAVSQVVTFAAGQIEAAPTFGTRVHPDYLLGMGRREDGIVPILDLERVLATSALMAAPAREAVPEAAPVAEAASVAEAGPAEAPPADRAPSARKRRKNARS